MAKRECSVAGGFMAASLREMDLNEVKKINLISFIKKRYHDVVIASEKENKATCICPFHDDSSPSMSISFEHGAWLFNCFACKKAGSIIDFIMAKENSSFEEALVIANEELGTFIQIGHDKKQKTETTSILLRLEKISDKNKAYQYLASRGIKEEALRPYKVGCIDKNIAAPLLKKYNNDELAEAGIMAKSTSNPPKYKFIWEKQCIVFFHEHETDISPITYASNRFFPELVVTYKDKLTKEEHQKKIKTLNLINSKKQFFFGEKWHKNSNVFIFEGIIDALSYAQITGKNNFIATLGVKSNILDLINKYTDKSFVIAFDNDKEGENSANAIALACGNAFAFNWDDFCRTYDVKGKDLNEILMQKPDIKVDLELFIVPKEEKSNQSAIGLISSFAVKPTDIDMRQLWAFYFNDKFKFNTTNECFYYWNGYKWEIDLLLQIERSFDELSDNVKAMQREVAKNIDADILKTGIALKFNNVIKYLATAQKRNSLAKIIKSHGDIVFNDKFIEYPCWQIPCKNGIVNLQNGELMPHDRSKGYTRAAPYEYKKNATCPNWENFISKIFLGDDEKIAFMQKLCGYFLTGKLIYQYLFIFFGGGENGKSLFVETLVKILGEDFTAMADREFFFPKKFGSNNNENINKMNLFQTRLCYTDEVEANTPLDNAGVKLVTSGGKIKGRHNYAKNSTVFEMTGKTAIVTNSIPEMKGADHGFWRRLVVIDFLYSFKTDPERKTRIDVVEMFDKEIEGIFNWMVKGAVICYKEYKEGQPFLLRTLLSRADKIRMDAIPIYSFVKQNCSEAITATATNVNKVYNAFKFYAVQAGIEHISRKEFITNLRQMNYTVTDAPEHVNLLLSDVYEDIAEALPLNDNKISGSMDKLITTYTAKFNDNFLKYVELFKLENDERINNSSEFYIDQCLLLCDFIKRANTKNNFTEIDKDFLIFLNVNKIQILDMYIKITTLKSPFIRDFMKQLQPDLGTFMSWLEDYSL